MRARLTALIGALAVLAPTALLAGSRAAMTGGAQ